MAFKMKGPMFFGSAIKKYGKKSETKPMMKKETGEDDGAKPDYIDIDGDGNKEESMKEAAADKQGSGMNYGSSAMKHYSSHKEYMTHDPSEGPMSDKRHNHPDRPAPKMTHGGKDKKGGPKMKYGKKDPAPKMVHSGKKKKGGPKMKHNKPAPKMYDKKGGPKMKDKNPAPKMNYDKKKKQGKSLNQVNINQK